MNVKNNLVNKTLLLLLTIFTLASCHSSIDFGGKKGNGKIIKQTRTITENFDKIEVSTGIDLIISQNDGISVEVETDENIQELISTTVQNGVLTVTSNASYDTYNSPIVRANIPIISGLKSTSGSTIKSGNTLKTTSLIVDSSSGSEISLDVEADYISLESSSGSEIEVTGKALKVETSSSSGSDIDAGNLMANEVTAQVSSGSSTKVYPIVSLKGRASSGGDIRYKNVPKKLEKDESSGGSVEKY